MKKIVFKLVGITMAAALFFGVVTADANYNVSGKTTNLQTLSNEHGETF
ncbi:hypothetical protein [Tuberibacillus calidus]|jgi:hypothetical protein|nr:hypothetical protein [Tuberibacillus calidus]